MLKTVELDSWEHFEETIRPITSWQIENRIEMDSGVTVYTPFLFRGQTNSEWGLDTTLERSLGRNKSLSSYQSLISQILPDLETFTEKKWSIDTDMGESKITTAYNLPNTVQKLLHLEYMSYLRHFGFPSPLLDWSYSPYIAAYFAFREMASSAEKIAIFQYHQIYNQNDLPAKRKFPIITPLWSLEGIRNNKRHFLQQSIYTLCMNSEKDNTPYFAHHETVYKTANEEAEFKNFHSAEFITKYTIPANEREKALMKLGIYNINSFSLMGSEESLLETLYLQVAARYKAWKTIAPNSYSSLD